MTVPGLADGHAEVSRAWTANARFKMAGLEDVDGHFTGTTALSWSGRFSEIPPVLVARLRRAAA